MINITEHSKICMIGLGKLGLPVAEVMSQKYETHGFDPAGIKSDKGVIMHETLEECVLNCDIIFIAVPTPHDALYGGEGPTSHLPRKDFDYSILQDTLSKLAHCTDGNQLIVNISTVLPGTIRNIVVDLQLAHRFVYNPSLIAMGTVADDFEHPDIFVAGFDRWTHNENAQSIGNQLLNFYKRLWKTMPHATFGTFEEAECIKIFHNTYISAKLGIANMIADVTHVMGNANPTVIAESLRHADRIVSTRYMEPGMGDGGPCHPRDNIALSWLAKKLNLGYDLFSDIISAREIQAKNVANELLAHKLPVIILGKSFKPGVSLTDGSSSMLVGHYVEQAGNTVQYDLISQSPAVYLLAHDTEYKDFNPAQGSVVIDMYRKWKTKLPHVKVVYYGMKHKS